MNFKKTQSTISLLLYARHFRPPYSHIYNSQIPLLSLLARLGRGGERADTWSFINCLRSQVNKSRAGTQTQSVWQLPGKPCPPSSLVLTCLLQRCYRGTLFHGFSHLGLLMTTTTTLFLVRIWTQLLVGHFSGFLAYMVALAPGGYPTYISTPTLASSTWQLTPPCMGP